MLSEREVSQSWRTLFHAGKPITAEAVTKAEELIEELRPENPLRHRLNIELDELRRRALA